MDEMEILKKEIAKLKERNKRVEQDKSWETSNTRRISIALTTYILVVFILFTLHFDRPFYGAIIPTVGYSLSTLSLPFIKRWWIKHR